QRVLRGLEPAGGQMTVIVSGHEAHQATQLEMAAVAGPGAGGRRAVHDAPDAIDHDPIVPTMGASTSDRAGFAFGASRESVVDDTARNRLREWLEDEERMRKRMAAGQAADTTVTREELARLPGIALFEAMLDGRLPGAPIASTLDFLLVRVEPGLAVFQGEPMQRHYNPLGSVHGGWYATLLDSAL